MIPQVGWFLHTPFPSLEVFRTLPMRKEILQGVLGADLVGFHVYDYARHFLHACTRLMGSEVSFAARRLRWERPLPAEEGGGVMQHSVKVDAFPIGIDPQRFRRSLETGQVQERIEQLKKQFEGQTVLLGVDRVDYIKGMCKGARTVLVPCSHLVEASLCLLPPCWELAGALLEPAGGIANRSDRCGIFAGIPQKLLAMEALLTNHPELVGKVVLLR